MTDDALPLPAMTGAELQCSREYLGLSTSWLAQHMVMNERRMLRMEAEQESIPQALVTRLDDLYEETNTLVQRLTAEYRRKVKASDGNNVTALTYRTDRDYEEAGGTYPSRWHRMVMARVVSGAPGLILVYQE
jgi:hypothetical protein